ncbi:MAG: hypothetical protein ACOYYJ_09535 [Chloroflexota bacterium]
MSRHILPILTFLLALTACSPAVPLPTATATYTVTRPAPTATVPPTPTETPDWLPEGLKGVQERLAPGGFELAAGSEAGVYEIVGADGQKVEGVKVFEDGSTELTMMIDGKEEVLVTGAGAVTSQEGKLVWGLRQLENGVWSRPHGKTATEAAAGFEADYPYSLEIDMGSDKKDQMIATMFAEHERAMKDNAAKEFEGISVTINFELVENVDVKPDKWLYINSSAKSENGTLYIIPKSSKMMFGDGTKTASARPLQVGVTDINDWFLIKIKGSDGILQPPAVLVPIFAKDIDGSFKLLHSIVRESDMPIIGNYLTKDLRGKIGILQFRTQALKEYTIADSELFSFMVEVNRAYFNSGVYIPEENEEYYFTESLPPELSNCLLTLMNKYLD